jgi:hypothetical protein
VARCRTAAGPLPRWVRSSAARCRWVACAGSAGSRPFVCRPSSRPLVCALRLVESAVSHAGVHRVRGFARSGSSSPLFPMPMFIESAVWDPTGFGFAWSALRLRVGLRAKPRTRVEGSWRTADSMRSAAQNPGLDERWRANQRTRRPRQRANRWSRGPDHPNAGPGALVRGVSDVTISPQAARSMARLPSKAVDAAIRLIVGPMTEDPVRVAKAPTGIVRRATGSVRRWLGTSARGEGVHFDGLERLTGSRPSTCRFGPVGTIDFQRNGSLDFRVAFDRHALCSPGSFAWGRTWRWA